MSCEVAKLMLAVSLRCFPRDRKRWNCAASVLGLILIVQRSGIVLCQCHGETQC